MGWREMSFVEELRNRALELRNKIKMLENEVVDFYMDVVKKLLENGIDDIVAVGLYNGYKDELSEGIVIKNGSIYYVDKDNGIKRRIKDDEQLRRAIIYLYTGILLVSDPNHVVENIEIQLKRKGVLSRFI